VSDEVSVRELRNHTAAALRPVEDVKTKMPSLVAASPSGPGSWTK
jgi:hypothetical protein